MNGNHCRHCPVDPSKECWGQSVGRFCDFMDPDHPAHDPRYARNLIDRSEGIVPVQVVVTEMTFEQIEAQRLAYEALPEPERKRCCNG